jgi:hypothetical protein
LRPRKITFLGKQKPLGKKKGNMLYQKDVSESKRFLGQFEAIFLLVGVYKGFGKGYFTYSYERPNVPFVASATPIGEVSPTRVT